MSQAEKAYKDVDRALDILHYEPRDLDAFFAPKNVAVIGATETRGSVGRTILWNLISTPFGGTVFPVNPKRDSVLGIKAYPSISAVPAKVDLAVVVTPAPTVPGLIREAVDAGVKASVIISAGFKEVGPEGVELERQIMAEARRGLMRIIGPNCLGVMSPITGLNATFAAAMARPGKVGFISQSGALLTAVLDWSFRENVGFSAFVSTGSMLDVGWGDLIDYLGDDPNTESIVIYMETIGDARAFLSSAREVALTKPIIVIKPGRTAAAAKAAASHTGSLTGSDDVLEAAFRRVGVLRVDTIAELFSMAEVLGKQPRPRGPRLSIVTNAGGPGVLATDSLIVNGGKLAEVSEQTFGTLNEFLPDAWSHNNPIDVLGDASPERYAKTLEIAAKDPNSDGLLVILTPQAMTDPTQTAQALAPYARIPHKPVLASWMGGADVEAGVQILNRANIPTFEFPDQAARTFTYMWRYSDNLRLLYETPSTRSGYDPDRDQARDIIQKVRGSGRTILTEYEAKALLETYGIPTVKTMIAATEDEAVAAAEQIGYPVVLKLYSETITHKTDVGGVQLNLLTEAGVREAYHRIEASVAEKVGAEHFQGVTVQPMIKLEGYELILGSSSDPQFGPVMLFGLGGQLVEVFKDRALGLPPLNTTLARRMMERTKIFHALQGVRGREPVDVDALAQIVVQLSELIVEQPWIKELDINPLLASPNGLVALDARVVVYGQDVQEKDLPKLAIRPYPIQYVEHFTTRNGVDLMIRPIRPEDEPLMREFHTTLSERTVYMRFLHPLAFDQRASHERLSRISYIDYDRQMALVAVREDPETKKRRIVAAGRLSGMYGTNNAEFSMLITDDFQNVGLGTQMLSDLVRIGRDEKLHEIVGFIHPENYQMQRVAGNLGFKLDYNSEENLVEARIVVDDQHDGGSHGAQ